MSQKLSTETICIQGGWQPKNGEPRQLPIYQSTTFKYETLSLIHISTLVTLTLAVLASYAFSRYRFKGDKFVMMLFLSTQMFPAMTLLIALYNMYYKLGLWNTYTALVLACSTKDVYKRQVLYFYQQSMFWGNDHHARWNGGAAQCIHSKKSNPFHLACGCRLYTSRCV